MLDNYNVPAKMLFGTLVIFVFFILSFMVLIGTYSDPLAKWLLLPVTISFGVALMRCLNNLKEYVDLKEEIAEAEEKHIILTTCPDYWVKDTVYVNQPSVSTKPKAITVCKNYARTEDNKMTFVGGSTRKNTNEVSKFVQNYGSLDSLNSKHTEIDTQNMLESTANGSKCDAVVENFISTGDQYLSQIVEGDSNIKFRMTDKANEDQLVTYYNKDATDASWMSESNNMVDIKHFHHTGDVIIHDHTSAGHEDVNNPSWHSHDYDSTLSTHQLRGADINDKWIYENTDVGGVEINMDKLNQASNLCELANKFYWTEATNKCTFAN